MNLPEPENGSMDLNTLAKSIVDKATGEGSQADPQPESAATKRGRARANALTPERRAEIAKKAAGKRWESKIETGE